MTSEWIAAFPKISKPFLEEVDHILSCPLSRIMAEGPNSTLTATENAQPAIMATSVLILRILEKEFGFDTANTVHFTLGHSLGEFAALVAGGYLRHRDALRMVRRRAMIMAECGRDAVQRQGGGEMGMVALVCEPDQRDSMIEAIRACSDADSQDLSSDGKQTQHELDSAVLIANINSKNQIVLSGNVQRIKDLLARIRKFAGHDPRAVRLKADSPFHSPVMEPAAKEMASILAEPSSEMPEENVITFPGLFPCISNVSARPFADRQQLKDMLARQCVETVLWHDSIQYLDRQAKVRRWIGIGPGKVGRNLVGKEVGMQGAVKGGGVWGVNEPSDIEEVMRALEATLAFHEP